jgi:mRNA-degrading endonuclease toxin of MazEF toxin-antitoxin module
VIQNDVGNQFSPNIIVAAISSQLPRRQYPTNLVVRLASSDAERARIRDEARKGPEVAAPGAA